MEYPISLFLLEWHYEKESKNEQKLFATHKRMYIVVMALFANRTHVFYSMPAFGGHEQSE